MLWTISDSYTILILDWLLTQWKQMNRMPVACVEFTHIQE